MLLPPVQVSTAPEAQPSQDTSSTGSSCTAPGRSQPPAVASPGAVSSQPPLWPAWCCEQSLVLGKLGSPEGKSREPHLPSSQGSRKASAQVRGHWDPRMVLGEDSHPWAVAGQSFSPETFGKWARGGRRHGVNPRTAGVLI